MIPFIHSLDLELQKFKILPLYRQNEFMTKKAQELTTVLSDLKKDYLAKLPNRIEKLYELAGNENWEDLYTEYHKLKGTGKTYGFPEISIACERLESLVQQEENQKVSFFKEAASLIKDIHLSYIEGKKIDIASHPFGKTLLRSGRNK